MKRALVVVLAVVAVALAAWMRSRAAPSPPALATSAQVATKLPSAPRAPARMLGVNEGLAQPVRNALAGPSYEAAIGRRALMLHDLGAGVVRVNSHGWPGVNHLQWAGPAGLDRVVLAAGRADLDVVVVLGPWPGARTVSATDHYVPDDLAAYAAWVTSVVERYDGDGIDDAPGLLRPVRAWEVDNEPDVHNSVAPRGADIPEDFDPGTFSTPEEYVRVLLATSAAIRAADTHVTVLLGGMYPGLNEDTETYIGEVCSEPGVRAAIDGVSVHSYTTRDSLAPLEHTLTVARESAPGLPVWVTETSVPSDARAEARSEHIDDDWQARMLVGLVGTALADGAVTVLWHSLIDAPPGDAGAPAGLRSNSLFRPIGEGHVTWEPKPAATVYARLAARLAGAEPTSVAEVPATGGRLLATPEGWLAFEGAPVLPPGAGVVTELLTGEVRSGGERAFAPAWIAPR